MIPEKDKTYAIACLGPYEYNKYKGTGKYTGVVQNWGNQIEDEIVYQFIIPEEPNSFLWFADEDILCEAKL